MEKVAFFQTVQMPLMGRVRMFSESLPVKASTRFIVRPEVLAVVWTLETPLFLANKDKSKKPSNSYRTF